MKGLNDDQQLTLGMDKLILYWTWFFLIPTAFTDSFNIPEYMYNGYLTAGVIYLFAIISSYILTLWLFILYKKEDQDNERN